MGPIAHLRLFCDNCGQETNTFVAVGASRAKVKCEHCRHVFEYVAGMMYVHVGTVTEIPSWARIDNGLAEPGEPSAPMPLPPQRSELMHQVPYAGGTEPPPGRRCNGPSCPTCPNKTTTRTSRCKPTGKS